MDFLLRFFKGAYCIRFFSSDPERILNLTLRKNLPVWGIRREKDSVSFLVSPFYKDRLCALLFLQKGERLESSPWGMLFFLTLFRKRYGLFAGFCILALALWLSSFFLWGIEIRGNTSVSEDTLCRQLAEFGLVPGVPLSKIDAKELALRFSVEHPEYVYVGINPVGTRAVVEIREREQFPKSEQEEGGFSNLVAETYGKIVRFEILSGKAEVKQGDRITAGTLLVSGVKETKSGSFYPVRAAGKVFAETEREFSVTVPFREKKRVFTGEEKCRKSYEILGFCLPDPVFSPKGEEGDRVLESAERLQLFGFDLPVVVKEQVFLKTEEKNTVIKVDRAEKLAYDKYEQFKRDTFANGDEILSETLSLTVEEEGVVLTAQLRAVENVCKEVPFRFVEDPLRN